MPFSLEMSFSWVPQSFLTVFLSPAIPLTLPDVFLIFLFWWSLVTPSSAPRHWIGHLQVPPVGSIGQNPGQSPYWSIPRSTHTSQPKAAAPFWFCLQSSQLSCFSHYHLVGVRLWPMPISTLSRVSWAPASKSQPQETNLLLSEGSFPFNSR